MLFPPVRESRGVGFLSHECVYQQGSSTELWCPEDLLEVHYKAWLSKALATWLGSISRHSHPLGGQGLAPNPKHLRLNSHDWSFWWLVQPPHLSRGLQWIIPIAYQIRLLLRTFQGFWSSMRGTRDKIQIYSLLCHNVPFCSANCSKSSGTQFPWWGGVTSWDKTRWLEGIEIPRR